MVYASIAEGTRANPEDAEAESRVEGKAELLANGHCSHVSRTDRRVSAVSELARPGSLIRRVDPAIQGWSRRSVPS